MQGMDVDNRMALYQHIVLSGGSTMFGGLSQRLEADLRALYLQHTLQVSPCFPKPPWVQDSHIHCIGA